LSIKRLTLLARKIAKESICEPLRHSANFTHEDALLHGAWFVLAAGGGAASHKRPGRRRDI
jgi:hypothetical protein